MDSSCRACPEKAGFQNRPNRINEQHGRGSFVIDLKESCRVKRAQEQRMEAPVPCASVPWEPI